MDREQFMEQVLIAYALGAPIPEPTTAAEHHLAQALMRGVDVIKARGWALNLPARLPD